MIYPAIMTVIGSGVLALLMTWWCPRSPRSSTA